MDEYNNSQQQSYYTEEYTKKKRKGLPLNYFTVSFISMILGGLIFGTTFAFLTPMIIQQQHINTEKVMIEQRIEPQLQENETSVNNTVTVAKYNPNTVLTGSQINKKVGPAVVGIVSKVEARNFWGDLYEAEGNGSGIIISSDGYIVTNNHVIDGGKEITVILSDANRSTIEESKNNQNEYKAKLIGADPKTDLAILKIDAEGLPSAQLGDSSTLEVGDRAFAIGNPLGQEFAGSFTGGYISALNRTIQVDGRELTLIQTDAAINPGNSGGALVNSNGEVIGINTVKISIENVEGMGFAIPINEALPIINDLKIHGKVKGRPLIGIAGRDVTENLAENYSLPMGIYVLEVTPSSGADRAGIKKYDIITKFNGERVKTMVELNALKEQLKVGDVVEVEIFREGKTKVLKLKLLEER